MWFNLDLSAINWLPVFAATLAAFLIGGVWYTALFGNTWVKLHGYTETQLKDMAKSQARTMVIFFFVHLIEATILAVIATHLDVTALTGGLLLGLLVWLGFNATSLLMHSAAHRRPAAAYAIDASHSFVCLLAMGAIIGAWR